MFTFLLSSVDFNLTTFLTKNSAFAVFELFRKKATKFVKDCIQSSEAVQISLQFDEFYDKKIKNSVFTVFELFRKRISKLQFRADLRISSKTL